jgi:hypothetical protein
MAKVEQLLNNATNIPAKFKYDFSESLKLYREWAQKEDAREFGEYLSALWSYAKYVVEHHYPLYEIHEKQPSLLHLLTQKGVVAFPEEGVKSKWR